MYVADDSDSDCYDHDGNWTSSDSDVETKENSKKSKFWFFNAAMKQCTWSSK